MKHIIISVICIIIICAYSLFSCKYTKKITSDIENIINYSDNNGYYITQIDKLFDILYQNENIFLFMMNKEYYDLLEEYAINLKYSVEFSDEQNIQIYKTMILNILNDINKSNIYPM